jgi:GH35 family endo-1,4-beta-xylanase
MSDEIELQVVKKASGSQSKRQKSKKPEVSTVEQLLIEDPDLSIDTLREMASVLRRRHFNQITHEQAMEQLVSDKKLLEEFKAAL